MERPIEGGHLHALNMLAGALPVIRRKRFHAGRRTVSLTPPTQFLWPFVVLAFGFCILLDAATFALAVALSITFFIGGFPIWCWMCCQTGRESGQEYDNLLFEDMDGSEDVPGDVSRRKRKRRGPHPFLRPFVYGFFVADCVEGMVLALLYALGHA